MPDVEWISVDDKLPDRANIEMVLITDGTDVWAGYYLLNIWRALIPSFEYNATIKHPRVTHWARMPSPPEP